MFKVLKGFILANGFEGVVGAEVSEDKFTPTELESLVADGSLEATTTEEPKGDSENGEAKSENNVAPENGSDAKSSGENQGA